MTESSAAQTVIHKQHPEGDVCPVCDTDTLERDVFESETISFQDRFGPWHCIECGWTAPLYCEYHGGSLPCDDCAESDAEELSL